MSGNLLFMLLCWQAIQITILVVATRLLLRWVGRNRPFLAHTLWAIVLIKCITPPVWSSSLGVFSQLRLPDASQFAQAMPSLGLSTPMLGATQNDAARNDPIQGRTIHESAATTSSGIETPAGTRSTSSAPNDQSSSITAKWTVESAEESNQSPATQPVAVHSTTGYLPSRVVVCLMLVWVVGVMLFAARLAWQVLSFFKRLRHIPKRVCPEMETEARCLALQLGVRRRIRIEIIDGDIGPAVLGWFRPRVLIPAILVDRADRQSLKSLIAHELIHVRRGDLWWAGLQELAKCLWWFHPWVRHAIRSLTDEAEKSCDQQTIAALKCKPVEYARCLLDVLAHKHELRSAPTFPGVRAIDITTERMERIMDKDVKRRIHVGWYGWPLLLLGCTIVLPGAQSVRADDDDGKPSHVETQSSIAPSSDSPSSESPSNESPSSPGDTFQDAIPLQIRKGVGVISPKETKTPQAPAEPQDQVEPLSSVPLEIRKPAEPIQRYALQPPAQPKPSGSPAPSPPGFEVQPQPAAEPAPAPRLPLLGSIPILGAAFSRRPAEAPVNNEGRQIFVEAKLLMIPEDQWDDLEIDWQTPNGSALKSVHPTHQPVPAPLPSTDSSLSDTTTDSIAPRSSDAKPIAFQDETQAATDPRMVSDVRVAARTVVQRTDAMEIALVENDPTRIIIESIDGSRVISAPHMVTLDGRAVAMEVGKQEVLVTGYKMPGDGKQIEPILSEVTVGTKLTLTPTIVDRRFVHLDLNVAVSQVPNAAATNKLILQGANKGSGEVKSSGQNLRHPVDGSAIHSIAVSEIATALNIPLDRRLVVGGLKLEDQGKAYRLLCLFRCALIPPPDAVPQSPNKPDDLAPLDPTAPSTTPQSSANSQDSIFHFSLLGNDAADVSVEGIIAIQQQGPQAELTLRDAKIKWPNGDQIAADKARLELNPDSAVAKLSGNVRIRIDSQKFQADQAIIDSQNLSLTGNVVVSSKDMRFKTGDLQLTVEDE